MKSGFGKRRPNWIGRFRNLLVVLLVLVIVAHQLGRQRIERYYNYWTTGQINCFGLSFELPPGGRDTIKADMLNNGVWEPYTTSLIRSYLKPGMTVVDIGAHIGWYSTIACKELGASGKIYAFEPEPTNYAALVRNTEANGCKNVVTEQKAVSNVNGQIKLFVNKDESGWNKIRNIGDSASEVPVEAVSLTEYFRDRPGPIHLVKIDTEGAEGLILKGMDELIDTHPELALVIEYHPHLWKEFGFNPPQVVKDLVAKGFKMWAVDDKLKSYSILDDTLFDFLSVRLFYEMEYVNILFKR
jgi:FkbM family methyltransferase